MRTKLVIVFGLVVALGLLLAGQQRWPLLQYLFFARYPLLMALVLLSLGPLSLWVVPSLFKNLFALSWRGTIVVTLLALLASGAVVITCELILRHAQSRFAAPPIVVPEWVACYRFVAAVLLAVPLIASVLKVSLTEGAPEEERAYARAGRYAGGVALGLAAAFAVLYVSSLIAIRFGSPAPEDVELLLPKQNCKLAAITQFAIPGKGAEKGLLDRIAPRLLALPDSVWEGYVDPWQRKLYAGHSLGLNFVGLTLLLYGVGYFVSHARLVRVGNPGVPALANMLLILILLAWALPGASFFLDRFRVPTLLPLVGLSFLSSWLFRTDHYFRLCAPPRERPAQPPALTSAATASLPGAAAPAPTEAFQAAENVQDARRRPVVVVAASGGGITAAVWTTRVLTALQAEVGTDFTRSIRLISSASGGSVGTMFFLDRFIRAGFPPAGELEAIVDAAAQPSLDAAAWGLAYPDLWRMFIGFLLRDKTRDRGWALEQAWRKHLERAVPARRVEPSTLTGWQQSIREGWLPAAVLNSTTVEAGRPFWLTGLDLPKSGGGASFFDTFPGHDLPVSTAARLSATFPWVSPIARALGARGEAVSPAYHFADGGYYDNFGITTIIHWLSSLAERDLDEIKRRGLLLVQIRAFPPREPDPDPDEDRGWLYATVGPVITLLNVMGPSQSGRNATEVGLMMEQLTAKLGITPQSVDFVLEKEAPLSWKLTRQEKEAILAAWSEPGNGRALAEVRAAFGVG